MSTTLMVLYFCYCTAQCSVCSCVITDAVATCYLLLVQLPNSISTCSKHTMRSTSTRMLSQANTVTGICSYQRLYWHMQVGGCYNKVTERILKRLRKTISQTTVRALSANAMIVSRIKELTFIVLFMLLYAIYRPAGFR